MNQKTFLRYLYLGLFVMTCVIGWIMIHEGLPYIIHSDEETVFKRPFKRFFQYSMGDFTASTNLFDILLLSWYGMGYVLGWTLGLWSDLDSFKELLILQDSRLLIWGRLLSILYVAIGNVLICRFLAKFTDNRKNLILASLSIVCNPILLPSVFLMKLDGLVYLYSCILLVIGYSYMVEGKSSLRFWVYSLGFFSLAIRVELLIFLLIIILDDIFHSPRLLQKKKFIDSGKGALVGMLAATSLTLYPISLYYSLSAHTPGEGLERKISYGENIVNTILYNIKQPEFIEKLWLTWEYYLELIGYVLGPLLIGLFFLGLTGHRKHLYYALHILILLAIIGFFGYRLVHYALSISLLLEVTAILGLIQTSLKYKSWVLGIHLTWVSTIMGFYLFQIESYPSPLTKTRNYLLSTSSYEDLLAIESLITGSTHPHLWECNMQEKIRVAKEVSKYGGTQYQLLLEQGVNGPCRNQLDICDENYLSEEKQKSNAFVNTLDIAHFDRLKPEWYIHVQPISHAIPPRTRRDSFYQYILSHYAVDTIFHKNEHFFDPRSRKINIRETFYVSRRKNY